MITRAARLHVFPSHPTYCIAAILLLSSSYIVVVFQHGYSSYAKPNPSSLGEKNLWKKLNVSENFIIVKF
jgi:hypothetical protein